MSFFSLETKLKHAIADYDKGIEINPHVPMAYNNRGGAYF